MCQGEDMADVWPLAGREHELSEISRLLRSADLGGVMLAGPAGVGKSRLAAEGAARSGRRWAHVLATRAAARFPLGTLAPLLPVDRRRTELRDDMIGAAVDVISADHQMLVVDDAHLLDDASVTVVQHLAATTSTFVLLTVQTGPPLPSPLMTLWKDEVLRRLEITALSQAAVNEVLDVTLGSAIDGRCRRDIWEACLGNALYLREIVVGALESGVLRRVQGVWRLTGPLGATPRLSDLVEHRLAALGEQERDVLRLLAIGEPLDVAALARAGDISVVEALEQRGMVRTWRDDGRVMVGLGHPMHGEVARHGMTAFSRMSVSRRLAEAVGPQDVLRYAVWRLDGGGALDPELALRAARLAYFRHDYEIAEQLASAAFDNGYGMAAGLLLMQVLGQTARWHALTAQLERQARTDEDVAKVAMVRAIALYWELGLDDESDAVLAAAQARLPVGPWHDEVTTQRACLAMLSGRFADATAATQPILDRQPQGRVLVETAVAAAPALAMTGRLTDAAAVAEQGWRAQLALGDQEVLSNTGVLIAAHALALCEAGLLAEANALLAQGYERAVARRERPGQAWCALLRGRVALLTGQLVTATKAFAEGAAVYAELGLTGPRRWCLAGQVLAAAWRGDVMAIATSAAELDSPTPMLMMEPDVLRAKAWAASAHDRPAAALIKDAIRHATATGAKTLTSAAWHDMARLGNARAAVAPLTALVGQVDGDLVTARAVHAQGLAAQDPGLLMSAADQFERLGALLLAAEATSVASAEYRRQGSPRSASRTARRARDLASRCEGAATPALALSGPAAMLTARERQVARLAAAGLTSQMIGRRLNVSVRTVDSHLLHAYHKLGVTSRGELAAVLT
jgi:DNA-binding CsgD family transcriptional regulator